jgi:hypothetical protein
MASIILATAGTAIGGTIGGSVLGISAATIGGAVGSIAGAAIDSWLVASMAPTQRIAGQRLDTLQITASTEGAVIPRVYGAMRTGGNIIWATDFREETRTTEQGGGKGGGGGGGTEVTEYTYFASFAVALCEGPITGIGRIWADGKLISRDSITLRLHKGGETQEPDPFIAAKMGAANTPAYRGTAYVVFEELPLERFGNRLPQLSFEVFRPILDGDSAESLVRAVTLIPASGEFAYHYQHLAEIETFVQAGTGRDAAFDALAGGVGIVLAADRTLGGLCDWVEAEAPRPVDLAIDGAATLKAAVIPIVLHYASADPLG